MAFTVHKSEANSIAKCELSSTTCLSVIHIPGMLAQGKRLKPMVKVVVFEM